MDRQNRQLVYMGSSKKDAEKLPQEVKDLFLDALMMALIGKTHKLDVPLFLAQRRIL